MIPLFVQQSHKKKGGWLLTSLILFLVYFYAFQMSSELKIAGMLLNISNLTSCILPSWYFIAIVSLIIAQILMCQGATIVDQSVCISRWGSYVDDAYSWDGSSWKTQENSSSTVCINFFNEDSKLIAWFTTPHKHILLIGHSARDDNMSVWFWYLSYFPLETPWLVYL